MGGSFSGGGDFGGDAFKGNLLGGVVSVAGSSGHAEASAISDIGGQVADIARTQGELNAWRRRVKRILT